LTGRILGPNISHWQLMSPKGSYLSHQEGCKGRIIQLVHRNTYQAVGRPFCEKCERFVGKKAWRQYDYMLAKGLLDWSSAGRVFGDDRFFRLFQECDPPEVEQAREIIERMSPAQLREYVKELDPSLVAIVEGLRKAPPDQPRLEEPMPDYVLTKGKVTLNIPYGELSGPAFDDLAIDIEAIDESEFSTKELQAHITYLARRAQERTHQEREEGGVPCDPMTAPVIPVMTGHQSGPVAQEMKKKRPTRRKVRRSRRY